MTVCGQFEGGFLEHAAEGTWEGPRRVGANVRPSNVQRRGTGCGSMTIVETGIVEFEQLPKVHRNVNSKLVGHRDWS